MSVTSLLSVSMGNKKMGNIHSVSLPAIKTCRKNCPCASKCYAMRMMKRRACIRNAYEKNLQLWYDFPKIYEMEIVVASISQNVFRWHVSGDIPDSRYLEMMVRVAKTCKNTTYFAFTKQYEIVNAYLEKHRLPKNLVIIFSAWDGIAFENPHNLPVAHVLYKDGHNTLNGKKVKNVCCGDCMQCMLNGKGCWTLKHGEIVCFDEH